MSYSGAIKSFNPAKGWGFIECQETHEMFGKDIFVLSSALPNKSALKGQLVNFDVVEGDNGPQSANVQFLDDEFGGGNAGGCKGGGKGCWGGGGGAQFTAFGAPITPSKPRAIGASRAIITNGPEGGQYYGSIKSFNPAKGWGFIECAETHDIYGKDMFVLRGSLPGGDAQKGQEVTFTVAQSPTGPQAEQVQLVGAARFNVAQRSQGPVVGGPQRPAPQSHAPPMQTADHIGTVKSMSAQKGYGFVTSSVLMQLYGKDVFFQMKDLFAPVNVGDQVAFSVLQGQKGPMACNLEPFRPMGAYMAAAQQRPSPPQQQQQSWGSGPPRGNAGNAGMAGKDKVFFGTIKGINQEKAWGHISCPAASEIYGKDVFLRRSELETLGLDLGMLVSFRIAPAPKGPQATDVKLLPEGCFGVDGHDGGVFHGTVKSFNEGKGWGFVTSPEVQQTFGKDIFLHKRELAELSPAVGSTIQFSVEQGPTGQLEAKNVTSSEMGAYAAAPRIANGKGGKGARSAPY